MNKMTPDDYKLTGKDMARKLMADWSKPRNQPSMDMTTYKNDTKCNFCFMRNCVCENYRKGSE